MHLRSLIMKLITVETRVVVAMTIVMDTETMGLDERLRCLKSLPRTGK
jgi:hypothetical protein